MINILRNVLFIFTVGTVIALTEDAKIDYCQAELPTISSYEYKADDELLQVHIITRHGDRAPVVVLPSELGEQPWQCPRHKVVDGNAKLTINFNQVGCEQDGYCSIMPFKNQLWSGSCNKGQLTTSGINQMKSLGEHLKSIYIDELKLISEDWDKAKREVYIRSTDTQRTYLSSLSLMNGMFPHNPNGFNVSILPFEAETLLVLPNTCKKLNRIDNKIRDSSLYREFLISTDDSRNAIDEITGDVFKHDLNSVKLYIDGLQARQCHSFPLPCKNDNCITKSMIDTMVNLGNIENDLFYRRHPLVFPQAARLRIGGFLLELKRNLLFKVASHSQLNLVHPLPYSFRSPKLLLFSGHDQSLSAILASLQASQLHIPSYASSLSIELWSSPPSSSASPSPLRRYFLKFLYDGRPLLHLPWCQSNSNCPLPNFLQYLDLQLGIVGTFENYHSEMMMNYTLPPRWDYQKECDTP